MPYIGKTPSQATRQRYYLTASGGETSVSGTMTVGGTLTFTDGEFVDVSVNGVALVAGTDYNTNTANTIAGLSALSANDQVEIVVYDTFSVFSGDIDSNLSVGGNLSVTGTITGGTLEATADTSAGDSAAIGFTSAEGLILTGQGSTSDITLKNDADATVFSVPTGTDDILFPDNAKAIFGAGSDLQIYHDGNNSYVEDAGSGYLVLKGSDPGIALQNSSAANLLLTGTNDISLLFSGNAKLATTNTGVDITGTAVTDGLTSECAAGDSNLALTAYHPTSTSARNIAKFQSNVGSTQADVVTIGCDGGIEAIGEITATGGALSQNSNGIRTVIGNDGGSGTFGTSTNHQVKFFTNNNHVATLDTSGRFLVRKSSTGLATSGLEANFSADNGFLGVTSTGSTAHFNRQFSDGTLITFRHDNSSEGSISISGTTVSYNGGHISRWSRLADDSKDTNIVKGTVMTNLDKMVVWHHEAKEATLYEDGDEIPEGKKVGDEKTPAVAAYDEDNEQLNCMAVSSVEGDINVAGVFVNWDEDDDYNDMNVAMTGDMVIRIAKDTTVARGDLLMSAGDGTAKPQGDDIVRSKTIAKVTSTVKSHTYDDGTYLVPCVLMAC